MKKKNQTRHSPKRIQQALARVRGGESLTKVAESMGIAKSLIKYWKDRNIQTSPNPMVTATDLQTSRRTKKFMDRCWTSMSLAFRQLQRELKKESPKGVKDLTLCLSILFDKLVAASQSLQSQVSPGVAPSWEASEETLMILQRHRESNPPEAVPVEPPESNLAATDVEPEKKDGTGPKDALEGEPKP